MRRLAVVLLPAIASLLCAAPAFGRIGPARCRRECGWATEHCHGKRASRWRCRGGVILRCDLTPGLTCRNYPIWDVTATTTTSTAPVTTTSLQPAVCGPERGAEYVQSYEFVGALAENGCPFPWPAAPYTQMRATLYVDRIDAALRPGEYHRFLHGRLGVRLVDPVSGKHGDRIVYTPAVGTPTFHDWKMEAAFAWRRPNRYAGRLVASLHGLPRPRDECREPVPGSVEVRVERAGKSQLLCRIRYSGVWSWLDN